MVMFSKIRNKLRWFIIILALHLPLLCYTDNEISHSNQNKSNNSNILNLLEQAEEARELRIQDAIVFGNEALELAKQIQSQKLEVEALISISESYRRTGEYDKSKLLGDKALFIADELQDNLLISKALVNISYLMITINDVRTAFDTCSQLLRINYEKKNEFVGIAYVYIGKIYRRIENYEKAIRYHLKALNHLENNDYLEYYKFENYFEFQSHITANLGYDYRYIGDIEKSLDTFFRLLELTPQSETNRYGTALNHIGVTYLIMENFEKALDYCEQALSYFEIENKPHKMSNIYNDLARIYFLTGDFQKALEYNHISLNNRKTLKMTTLIASSYRNIADNYLDIADYAKSEKYYLKSIAEAEKVSDHNILQYVHGRMAEMYEEQNKDSSALQSFKKYNALYKILQDRELQARMVNEQFNLEITTIEQENSFLKKSNTNLNQEVEISKKISSSLLYILSIVVLVLIFAIVIYYDKKRYSRRLEVEVASKTKELNNSRMVLKNIDAEKEILVSDMMNLRYTYENLVQNLGEGVGIISPDEEFLAVNPAAEKIFGIHSKELVGRNLREFIDNEQYNMVLKKTLNLNDGEISSYELTIIRPTGEKRNIIVTASPINNKEGKLISILGIYRDITDRINDENKIKEILRKNIDLLRELEHRVKNNIQLVYSITRMLTQTEKNENVQQIMSKFENSIYVISLIHDLILPEDKHYIDFQRYINNIFTNLISSIPNNLKQIKFENENTIDKISINYATSLGMIVNELITNSLIHAFSEGANKIIMLKYYRIDDENVLEYSDNGIGIEGDIDITNYESFGLKMIYLQSRQLLGKLEIETNDGFYLKLSFKDLAISTYKKV